MNPIQRAEAAKIVLDNPLVKEAFETLERDIFEAWSRSKIRDKEAQHELLLMMQTARKFRAIFEQLVQTGEMEKLQKPRLRMQLERLGIFD